MTIAIPSFSAMVKNNRLVGAHNSFVGAISNARQVAIARGQAVLICHSLNADAANPSCGGSGSGWNKGILVYATTNSPTSLRAYSSSTDEIIQRINMERTLTVTANTAALNYLGFGGNGQRFASGSMPIIAVCDDRGVSHGKLLTINVAGKFRVSEPTNCTTPA